MANTSRAAHVLGSQYPELMTDSVSRYVSRLKDTLGAAGSSAVYSVACRSAPLPDNPLHLKRGSVATIRGEKYLALGSGFMTLEFASLDRPGKLLTLGPDEFSRLDEDAFCIMNAEASGELLEPLLD